MTWTTRSTVTPPGHPLMTTVVFTSPVDVPDRRRRPPSHSGCCGSCSGIWSPGSSPTKTPWPVESSVRPAGRRPDRQGREGRGRGVGRLPALLGVGPVPVGGHGHRQRALGVVDRALGRAPASAGRHSRRRRRGRGRAARRASRPGSPVPRRRGPACGAVEPGTSPPVVSAGRGPGWVRSGSTGSQASVTAEPSMVAPSADSSAVTKSVTSGKRSSRSKARPRRSTASTSAGQRPLRASRPAAAGPGGRRRPGSRAGTPGGR